MADSVKNNKTPPMWGIVHSQFNADLCQRLVLGAENFLESKGITGRQIIKLEVPGAFELPLGAKYLASMRPVAPVGLVALGVVIRGETPHFEYVASQSASGIMQVGLEFGIPIGYGVITADTYEQAENRADTEILKSSANVKQEKAKVKTNNGYQAAEAIWKMVQAKKSLSVK